MIQHNLLYKVMSLFCLLGSICFAQESATQTQPVTKSVSTITPIVEADSLIDWRDGTEYKTVKVGGLVWMAENLNFATTENSWCFNNKEKICSVAGRLYSWNNAQTVCPEQWHLPDNSEWHALFEYIDQQNGGNFPGKDMKAGYGWLSGANGIDTYLFTALPAGIYRVGSHFESAGRYGVWWSASERDYYNGYYWHLEYQSHRHLQSHHVKVDGFSVRCVQDPVTPLP